MEKNYNKMLKKELLTEVKRLAIELKFSEEIANDLKDKYIAERQKVAKLYRLAGIQVSVIIALAGYIVYTLV